MIKVLHELEATDLVVLGQLTERVRILIDVEKAPVSRKAFLRSFPRSIAECRVCSERSIWPPIDGVRVIACQSCQRDAIADFKLIE